MVYIIHCITSDPILCVTPNIRLKKKLCVDVSSFFLCCCGLFAYKYPINCFFDSQVLQLTYSYKFHQDVYLSSLRVSRTFKTAILSSVSTSIVNWMHMQRQEQDLKTTKLKSKTFFRYVNDTLERFSSDLKMTRMNFEQHCAIRACFRSMETFLVPKDIGKQTCLDLLRATKNDANFLQTYYYMLKYLNVWVWSTVYGFAFFIAEQSFTKCLYLKVNVFHQEVF